jgi:antitoxin component HigA of HigAB toxin-antitoxin module
MANPMIREFDSATNEVIDREMTADEFKQYQADELAIASKPEPTIAEKLESVGLSVAELKAALGL